MTAQREANLATGQRKEGRECGSKQCLTNSGLLTGMAESMFLHAITCYKLMYQAVEMWLRSYEEKKLI